MNGRLLVASAVAAALALPLVSSAGPAEVPKYSNEKCYGIAKAGKNDCETRMSSCGGTSKRDNQKDAWIYVPKGSCDKIVGAALAPKA